MISNYYFIGNIGDQVVDERTKYIGTGVYVKGEKLPCLYWWETGSYSPPMALELPSFINDRIDFKIKTIKTNYSDGSLSIDFTIDNKFFYIHRATIDRYDEESYFLDEDVLVYCNDELIDEFNFQSRDKNHDQDFHIDIKFDTTKENVNLKFVSKSNILGPPDTDIVETISLNTKKQTEYNIVLNDSQEQTILNPIALDDFNIIYEELHFIKLFPDIYSFPETTHSLFHVSYEDNLNGYSLSLPNKISLKTNLSGYDDSLYINAFLNENNDYQINDYYFYDYKNDKILYGFDKKFKSEKGIILPWDEKNNLGYIYFDLNFTSYKEYNIHFNLPIGNTNRLRGEGGKYNFEKIL